MAALAAPASAAGQFTHGSSGLGDEYFPFAGNGGYDVSHYDLELEFERATNFLEGEAEISARATQSLSRFNLDLRPFMEVSNVEVDGRRASFTREGDHELVITPRKGIRRGSKFRVEVDYSGTPRAADYIANSIHGQAIVLGRPLTPLQGLDLALEGVVLEHNGEIVGTYSAAEVMGNPLNALAWLANHLGTRGLALNPGDVVMSGAISKMLRPKVGDTIRARFSRLGSVGIKVVP